MTAATTNPPKPKPSKWEDPEQYRMSVGEHLEELRHRLILALAGFVIVLIVCLFFGNTVVAYFCRPLLVALKSYNLPPWLFERKLGGSFMVFLQISLITAAAISAPWAIYQMWLFIAAGLYPQERKWIMRYAPLSIILLIGGMLFVYFVVLPITIDFFIGFAVRFSPPIDFARTVTIVPTTMPITVPVMPGSPDISTLNEGMLWFDSIQGKLNIIVGGKLRSLPFAPDSLVVPQYELQDYINLTVLMLIMFGLAFQLPLIVAAIIKIGIIEPAQFRAARRYVYFGLLIVSAAVTPGDVITATILLLGPLILLYEFGIILGELGGKRDETA